MTATVSGSFHRHMGAIGEAVAELRDLGVRVLSPADPRVVGEDGDFLFVASDRVLVPKVVQDRHLRSIASSDFLWLVTPDGYVGSSAAMELGFAVGVGVPVRATHAPEDLTLRQHVRVFSTMRDAVERR